MSLPISSIPGIGAAILPVKAGAAAAPGVFQSLLQQSITTVEAQRTAAQQSVDRFLSGEGEELHQVALSTQKAELSLEMFLQVRNKVVQAYQDIMRMQI